MAHAASAPRVLARVVCVLSLASARGRHGLASAAPSATASGQCPSRPPPRARRACSPKAATARAFGSAELGGAFEVHPVAGDGRCLFRSVAVAMALRDGGARPPPEEETREADRLRAAAVDDLERRRDEVEWFIEGNFDAYCASMRQTRAWGGEPEILSLARVLGVRIEVFVDERQRLRSIGVYGGDDDDVCDDDERDETRPVAVVFRGAGHYEALARCDE
jgi:OTU domain-containing protein 6